MYEVLLKYIICYVIIGLIPGLIDVSHSLPLFHSAISCLAWLISLPHSSLSLNSLYFLLLYSALSVSLYVTRHKCRRKVGLFHGSLAVGPRVEQYLVFPTRHSSS